MIKRNNEMWTFTPLLTVGLKKRKVDGFSNYAELEIGTNTKKYKVEIKKLLLTPAIVHCF